MIDHSTVSNGSRVRQTFNQADPEDEGSGEPIFGNRKICGKYAATTRMVLKISCVQQIVATTPLLRG
jgi:hypothetical protein